MASSASRRSGTSPSLFDAGSFVQAELAQVFDDLDRLATAEQHAPQHVHADPGHDVGLPLDKRKAWTSSARD